MVTTRVSARDGQGGSSNEAGQSPAVKETTDGGQSDRRNAG